MSDYFKDNNDMTNSYSSENEQNNNVYSNSGSENTASSSTESSYEWNGSSESSSSTQNSEYHYSYINGNNENASHNPNNYENAYSTAPKSDYDNSYSSSTENTSYANSSNTQNNYNNGYVGNPYGYNGTNQQYQQPYSNAQPYPNQNNVKKVKAKKPKKPKKPLSRSFVAAMLAISLVVSAALGFGGGIAANRLSSTSSGSININKVTSNSGSNTSTSTSASTTSEIVKKTADSVVEIATESVVTGNFAQQYVQQGAGSGVIISSDGYIITNYHVIEGANTITVTLRDGKTSYTAAIIGSDSDNDIALLKIDAKDLTPATFGDSSKLAVGDYVVAIGNPLGELGGTVTDGIISALAREVTIDNKNMTLLQTNAQISPGNSGGGLFNANGELVGIVNAKDSATEVEGIGFAIPINNVLDIINDLKSYGYVTGKVDLGMQFTDITSNESAFYYGVNETGCYVISVTKGSNAEKAGFRTGDLVTKVGDTKISSSADVKTAIEDYKVGDEVTFTIYRSGETKKFKLTLAEYVPASGSTGSQSSTTPTDSGNYSGDDIWSQMFGW